MYSSGLLQDLPTGESEQLFGLSCRQKKTPGSVQSGGQIQTFTLLESPNGICCALGRPRKPRTITPIHIIAA